MKKWDVASQAAMTANGEVTVASIIDTLLINRAIVTDNEKQLFLRPMHPQQLTAEQVNIAPAALSATIERITLAISNKESIVVYADYDADGITAGAIMWETIHALGGNVMPYIPHRVEEGYGLSIKGIDAVVAKHNPTLIITVDHGITACEKVAYAKSVGIDVIVTDHHTKPDKLPDCLIVHTTTLCGSGISWFVAKELLSSSDLALRQAQGKQQGPTLSRLSELLALATIGTIADLVPLVGPNRAIVKYGLAAINKTKRVGLLALLAESGIGLGEVSTYSISHILAPRLNAMGRIEHAMDALRLLCTKNPQKALEYADQLGFTNKERQQLTETAASHAKESVRKSGLHEVKKLLFVVGDEYNQGVIGLVAGRLVEEFYLPAIVIARGEFVSKASARSIAGFNIVEAIKSASDLLVDVGGHPMAAGFTVETAKLSQLQERLEKYAQAEVTGAMLTRSLRIDCEISGSLITTDLWTAIQELAPFGLGNPEPVFVSRRFAVSDTRPVGKEGKHLKLKVYDQVTASTFDVIGFGFGVWESKLPNKSPVDIAYTLDQNTWNSHTTIQLKLKDIRTEMV